MGALTRKPNGLMPALISMPRLRGMLITALILLNVAAIGATLFALRNSYTEHVTNIEAETRSLARLADQSIAKSTAAFDLVLKTIRFELEASLRNTGKLDPMHLNALLADQERNLSHSAGIRIADASGRVILGSDVRPESRATWGDRDFFAQQRDTPDAGMTVTDPILGRVSNIWVVSFARRYDYPDGSFAGVISVAIPVSYFTTLLSSFDTTEGGVAVIRDSQLRLMARYPTSNDPNVQLGTRFFSRELEAALASGPNEVTYHTDAGADGQARILTYRRMSTAPFHLLIGMSPKAHLADWREEAGYSLVGLILFLLTTSAFTALLWRSIRTLKHETERNQTLLTNASDGIHILDRDGWLIEASDSFCRMLGYTREALIGKHVSFWDAHYPPEHLPDLLKAHFDTTQHIEFQTRHRHRDGQLIPVDISGRGMMLNGQPVIFYSSRDVTEKLRDQAALQASESRFRTLFESSPDASWITRDGVFIECNRAAIEMMGCNDRDDFLSTMPSAFSPPFQKGGERSSLKAQQLLDSALAGQTQRFDWIHRRKDGTEFFAEVTLSHINLHGQDVIFTQCRDVSEQKRAAAELERYRTSLESVVAHRTQELAKQRNHLEIILNNIPSAIGYWDAHLINRFSNPQYRAWLGVSLKGIQDRHITQVLNPDFLDRILPRAQAALAGKAQHFMVSLPCPDGRVRHTEASYIPDRVDGKVVGFFVLAVDVTDLKIAKDQAETANRAKSVFLANMSHELRTPMNGVLGMLGIARKRMTDPDGLDKLDKAKRSAERLLAILNDILDLSKIEADHVSLECMAFTPQALLTEVGEMLGEQASRNGSTLRIDVADTVRELSLMGDPLRLEQVLLNLVGNAVKFGAGRPIDIRMQAETTSAERVRLRVEIEDHGIGIAPEDQARLFRAFEQADGSTTRKYGGTGLGLTICKRLIDLMGGQIGVESSGTDGSLFWFELDLPRAPSAPTPNPPEPGETSVAPEARLRERHGGARVLVAEDEPFNQEIAQVLLDEAGLVADMTDNGEEALAKARAAHYDLILMDMQMPVLGGLEATRAIRADSQCTQTPIVAMTANAFESDRELCLAAGMVDHLAKPIDPDAFFSTVLAWLDQAAEAGVEEV